MVTLVILHRLSRRYYIARANYGAGWSIPPHDTQIVGSAVDRTSYLPPPMRLYDADRLLLNEEDRKFLPPKEFGFGKLLGQAAVLQELTDGDPATALKYFVDAQKTYTQNVQVCG